MSRPIFKWSIMLVLSSMLIILSAVPALAMIVEFKDYKIPPSSWNTEKQTMYSLVDTPLGSDQPYLDVNISLSSNKDGWASIIYFNYDNRNTLGQNVSPKKYCCTQELADKKRCAMGEVIINNASLLLAPFGVRKVFFSNVQPVANFEWRANITSTSTYYFVIANCPGSHTEGLLVNGKLEWRNPFGELPGAAIGLWYYYGLQALAYLLVSVGYGTLMFMYRTQLLRIQYGILGLLVIGMLQMFCWYIYESQRNKSGIQASGTGALVMAIFFTVVKGTVTRLVTLAVCMGIGLIKWTLGSTKVPVFALTAGYFVASLIYEAVETVKQTTSTELNSVVTALVIFGVWICDVIFVWWALISLIRTMGQLTLRRQTIKLEMYRKFFYVLVACVAVWAVSLLIHFFILASKDIEQIWRSNWVWLAFWHLSFFIIVCIVAVLWRPTKNNTRYGYSEVYYDDDDNDGLTDNPNETKSRNSNGPTGENEVQMHAMGTTSPVGETRVRNIKASGDGVDSPGLERRISGGWESSSPARFDTMSAFMADEDDDLTLPRKLE